MKKLFLFAISALLLSGAPQIRADDAELKAYMSSVYKDYVLTASHPPEWVTGRPLPDYDGFLIENIPTNIPGVTVTGHFDIRWGTQKSVFDDPFPNSVARAVIPSEILAALESGSATSAQLDQIIPKEGCGQLWMECAEFKRTPIQISNHQGLLIEYAREKVFDPDMNALVDPKGPSEFNIYFAPNKDRTSFYIRFDLRLTRTSEEWANQREEWFLPGTGDWVGKFSFSNTLLAPIYQEVLPDVLAFLESMKFRHLSELDEDAGIKRVYEGAVRTSQRQAFWARLYLKLTYPPDWEVREIESIPATREQAVGRLIATVTESGSASLAGEPEQLFIVLQGMDYSDKNFLGTTDPLVGMILPGAERLSSEPVEIESFGYLAKTQTKFINGTGKTYVNTYTGKDETGADLKVRTYTAGGQTTVANFIYVADAADFDRALPAIEEMVETAGFNLFNPIQ